MDMQKTVRDDTKLGWMRVWGEYHTQCTRCSYTGVVAWTASANLDASCCWCLCFSPKLC